MSIEIEVVAAGPPGPRGYTGNTGPTGPQGAKGDKGDTGAKGDKGDQGDQGVIGPTPSLSIGTVGTGAAAASLTGTSEEPVLNLTLPPVGADGVNTAAIQDSAVTSDKIANGTIVDADINAGAAIAPGKIAGTAVTESVIRAQDAGGSRASGTNHIIGDVNAIASDLGTAAILAGGSTNRENVIGAASTANVNTATSNLPTATGTEADWSVIVGGYDNVVNGWACAVTGYHNKVEGGANHCTISGGSIHTVAADAAYSTIGGGTLHTIDGDQATISGGSQNAASADKATVGGGATNTASGAQSTVGGGNGNTASGSGATVAGGVTNTVAGTNATCGGGVSNTPSGNNSAIAGGTSNVASGSSTAVGGGDTNTASEAGAVVIGGSHCAASSYYTIAGGYYSTASASYAVAIGREAVASRYGSHVQASGKFTAAGDAQSGVLTARLQTTDATPAVLGLDGTANTPIIIATNSTVAFEGLVVGRRVNAGGEASAAYQISGCIKNDGDTVSLVGTPTVTVLGEDDASWDCAVTAETSTSKSLKITVTGASGLTIQWVARLSFVETVG
jgi:hypothetical protein